MVGKISEISFTGNLGYMRFHDLRHTFATIVLQIKVAQGLAYVKGRLFAQSDQHRRLYVKTRDSTTETFPWEEFILRVPVCGTL